MLPLNANEPCECFFCQFDFRYESEKREAAMQWAASRRWTYRMCADELLAQMCHGVHEHVADRMYWLWRALEQLDLETRQHVAQEELFNRWLVLVSDDLIEHGGASIGEVMDVVDWRKAYTAGWTPGRAARAFRAGRPQ